MDCFDVFIIVLVRYCCFLVVHHDLVTTFELWHLTNISKQHILNFLSEINIFNKLLFFAWHSIAFFMLKVPLNTNQPTIGPKLLCANYYRWRLCETEREAG